MSDTLLVGSRKGLLRYHRDATGWQLAAQYFLGKPVSACWTNDADWWVALNEGHFGPKLHYSSNGGASWTELPAPAFPAGLAGEPSVQQIWVIAGERDALWAGCIPAGLFHSSDGGEHWSLVTSLWERPERAKWFGGGYDDAGIHSILIDPRTRQTLAVGISCGGVWRSEDEGQSWENRSHGLWAAYMPPERKDDLDIQDPHRIVQCPHAPNVFWCQHHNGQFVSSDELTSWREVKPPAPLSNFGFAVAVHPHDANTAWFVPAEADERRIPRDGDFYVLRTRDGGASFERLDRGLPAAPAYHLVYRHGLVVDHTGQRLAMASTTGSLWLSEDGGEQWQRLSAELPPVYCVQFVG